MLELLHSVLVMLAVAGLRKYGAKADETLQDTPFLDMLACIYPQLDLE